MDTPTLSQFLVWITAGGGIVFVSWLAERVPAFVALPSQYKLPLMGVLSVLLSLGAQAVNTYVPPEIMSQLNPWFVTVYSTIALLIANQVAHKLDPARNASDKLLERTEPPQ